MPSIIIRHLSGARTEQAQEFDTLQFHELVVGRDPAAQICFDSDGDDLVSRQHLKITRDPIDPEAFQIVDLESRNGCFLNKRRIFGSVRVSHGDVVELGMGGPRFQFELNPPPETSAVPTRDMAAGTNEFAGTTTSERYLPTDSGAGAPRPVGRATVERMLDDTFGRVRGESRRVMWLSLAGLVTILGVGWLTWSAFRQVSSETAAAKASTEERLRETNAQLAKNPALIASMRDEIISLQDQIRIAEQRNGQRDKELSELVQRAADAQAKQTKILAQNNQFKLAPPTIADDEFTLLKRKAQQLIDQERYNEALDVSQSLIRMDATRYEGYGLSGISLYFQREYAQAGTLLEQASARAPADQKGLLSNLAKQCRQLLEAPNPGR